MNAVPLLIEPVTIGAIVGFVGVALGLLAGNHLVWREKMVSSNRESALQRALLSQDAETREMADEVLQLKGLHRKIAVDYAAMSSRGAAVLESLLNNEAHLSLVSTLPSDIAPYYVPEGASVEAERIDCSTNVVVDGTLSGKSVSVTGLVCVGQSGQLIGSVQASAVVVAGKFDGSLKCTGLLVLLPSAVLTGDVEYGTLKVDEGAQFNCNLRKV